MPGFSSRSRCAHVLSAPVLSTPGMTRCMLWTMDLFFVCSAPPRRFFWLHHMVRGLVGSWSSWLRTNFPMKVSCSIVICCLMLVISKNIFLAGQILFQKIPTSSHLQSKCTITTYRKKWRIFQVRNTYHVRR